MHFELKIIETPRDGLQGLKNFVPTEVKIRYINQLLRAGFDTIEVGSFVSPKAVPQMADTEQVLRGLSLERKRSKIMVLVGNAQGGKKAVSFKIVDHILYPFSFSPSFLERNLNTDIDRSKAAIRELAKICGDHHKELIVYLTMAFGNPYGDPWSPEMVRDWAGYLVSEGIHIIPLSDIMGDVTPEKISTVYSMLLDEFPETEFGIHLHCRPDDWYGKVHAAWQAGIRRFDTVLGGLGGCPFAGDHLVSNLNTRALISYLENIGLDSGLNEDELKLADGIL